MTKPRHPYTMGLLKAVPKLDANENDKLVAIEGAPPNLAALPDTCAFLPRCPYACEECKGKPHPKLRPVGDHEHFAACHLNMGRED